MVPGVWRGVRVRERPGRSIRGKKDNYCKDLPLHPIPVALKWDHLLDLKLADSNFRTPARIDLLMGAEVFTSIHVLRDGRRTGPRGIPSAIDNGFGWVLFGNIKGSDVIYVANLTKEQDELKVLTGFRHSYAGRSRGGPGEPRVKLFLY